MAEEFTLNTNCNMNRFRQIGIIGRIKNGGKYLRKLLYVTSITDRSDHNNIKECQMYCFQWQCSLYGSRLDLTTFLFYLSKIASNLPENYLSKSKTTS